MIPHTTSPSISPTTLPPAPTLGHALDPTAPAAPAKSSKPRAKRRVMTPVSVIGEGDLARRVAEILEKRRPRRYSVARVPTFEGWDLAQAGDDGAEPGDSMAIFIPRDADGIEAILDRVRTMTGGEAPPLVLVALSEPLHPHALSAVRAGATDVLMFPNDPAKVNDRTDAAARRLQSIKQARLNERRLRNRVRRLTRSCRDSQGQLDRLSEDLVAAYQDLAGQMQHVVQSTQYASLVKSELDLEQVLRKTLEHLVERSGPTNAAVFLPAIGDEYALGGYVNYDCPDEAADMLLNHLADVLAPRVAEHEDAIHVCDDVTLEKWLGDDAAWLGDSHVVGFTARHEGEPLAVVSLFRDADQPFPADLLTAVQAIGPVLGETLARLIRVHHRGGPIGEDFHDDEPAWA